MINILIDSGAPSLYNLHGRKINKRKQMGSSFKDRINDDHSYIKNESYLTFREAYKNFLKEQSFNLTEYFNLDVINNTEETMQNQLWFEEQGLHPLPVFHLGSDKRYLEKMIDKYKYIALGGLVPNPPSVLRQPLDKFFLDYAGKKGKERVKIHGLAVTSTKLMIRYPWYSTDSTAWRKKAAYGAVYIPSKFIRGKPNWVSQPHIIYVSIKGVRRMQQGDHFNSLSKNNRKAIVDLLTEHGFKLKQLETNYKYRARWNAYYFLKVQEILGIKIYLAGADDKTIHYLIDLSKRFEVNILFSYFYLRSWAKKEVIKSGQVYALNQVLKEVQNGDKTKAKRRRRKTN
jgi:hypothetical protein